MPVCKLYFSGNVPWLKFQMCLHKIVQKYSLPVSWLFVGSVVIHPFWGPVLEMRTFSTLDQWYLLYCFFVSCFCLFKGTAFGFLDFITFFYFISFSVLDVFFLSTFLEFTTLFIPMSFFKNFFLFFSRLHAQHAAQTHDLRTRVVCSTDWTNQAPLPLSLCPWDGYIKSLVFSPFLFWSMSSKLWFPARTTLAAAYSWHSVSSQSPTTRISSFPLQFLLDPLVIYKSIA